jgi:translation initiation factor IF-3
MQLLSRVRDDLTEMAKVEAEPRLEGRQMIMILAPSAKSSGRAPSPPPAPAAATGA